MDRDGGRAETAREQQETENDETGEIAKERDRERERERERVNML